MEHTTEILKAVMDTCSARHTVLANNIANVETPGFKRKDINFKDALAKSIESGNIDDIRNFKPKVTEDKMAPARIDGNTVSTQKELGQISQNSLLYEVSTMALSSKYQRLKKAISSK